MEVLVVMEIKDLGKVTRPRFAQSRSGLVWLMEMVDSYSMGLAAADMLAGLYGEGILSALIKVLKQVKEV